MYDVFVKKEQTDLRKTLKEKLHSLKRHRDETAYCFQLCFTLHDPKYRKINVVQQREFTENLSDIMLIVQSWSICLFI